MSNYYGAVQLTAELVKIDSTNPTGNESEVISFIASWLDKEGISYELQEVETNRSNLIARVKGHGKRAPIVVIAHCDTVPLGEGWTHDPLGAEIEDGKMYGRGTSDMKAGVAAALYALKEVKNEMLPGDFVVAVSVDEEGPSMKGIMKMIEDKVIDKYTMVIAPEPTSLDIIRAHRGVMWYEITTHGKASHAGHAERGVDANHAMAEIICELKSAVNALPFDHQLLKKSLLSIGKLQGGAKTNVVPDKAVAEIDFRVVPPMDARDANELVRKAVSRAITFVPNATVEIKNLGLERDPVETPSDAEVIQRITKSYTKVVGNPPVQDGYVAYTDAAVTSWILGNKNAVCFGPGNLEQAHSIDEWASVKEIELCSEIFIDMALTE
ncbi:MAG: hypothetical protein CVU86_01410 [Firmicutes bacterium HGW-Firmicutes-11]|jgi:succinyl-diaminopimelate desuccinylase|nr:MAG: hypothetical protein CVU86_01410 [Firmicutes bacterium HGW-Firmicutes-11]